MPQATAQYSAAQILEAGRRAETEGRFEYAVQFYRHLTDFHAAAPEAATAREALARISARRTTDVPPSLPTIAAARSGAASGTNGHHGPASPTARTVASFPRENIRIAPVGAALGARRLVLPAPAPRYRIGRILARALSVLGLTAGVGGILILALQQGLVAQHAAVIPGAAVLAGQGLVGAAVLIAAGVLTFFLGQIARAVLDGSSAALDLVAIEHAKAARLNGEESPGA